MHTLNLFRHPWLHLQWKYSATLIFSGRHSELVFVNFSVLRIVVSPFYENVLRNLLSQTKDTFSQSFSGTTPFHNFCFLQKGHLFVPCFMVAIIPKDASYIFQQKMHFCFPWGDIETQLLILLLRVFLFHAGKLLQKPILKERGIKGKRSKSLLMHSLHSFDFSLNTLLFP